MAGPVALGPARWLVGCLTLGLLLGTLAWAATRVRAALLPGWRGGPARLAETVAGLGLVALGAQLVGGPGWFRSGPVAVAVATVALAAGIVAGIAAKGGSGRAERPVGNPGGWGARTERVGAAVAVALVGLGWVTHVADTYGRGMTEGDTLWYHGTFALRFVQLERLWVFPGIGTVVQDPFPANAQVLHALAFLPFGRDVLSPLVNLAFGGVVLLAAACIGRTRDVGALAVLGAATVMGLPTIAGTQPGQATNDVVCGALLLTAMAILLQAEPTPGSAGLAGVAAGLALSSKLTVTLPVVVLTVGVALFAARRRHPGLLLAWTVGMAPFPLFWFLRNWDLVGNPLPWYDLHLGPWHLRRTVELQAAESIADFFARFGEARTIWATGLGNAFGRLWPAVLVVVLAGGSVAFLPARRPWERLAGVTALAAVFGYVTTPYTMMFDGGLFQDTIRYSFAVLLLGTTLAALAAAAGGRQVRLTLLGALVVVAGTNLAAARSERLAPFVAATLPAALAVGAGAVLAAGLAVLVVRRGGRAGRLALVGAGALAVLVGGYAVQRDYLHHRYVDAGLPLDPVNAAVGPLAGARIAVLGSLHFYPLLGAAGRNEVRYLPGPAGGRNTCEGWRRVLARAGAEYVVMGEGGAFFYNPRRSWFEDDPALVRVTGGPGGVLYRVEGRVNPRCGSTAATRR